MAPKKAPAVEEPPVEQEEEEPQEVEIVNKCFRSGGQLYHGECKAGYKELQGTYVRHGFGRQVISAAAPAGPGPDGLPSFETVVLSTYDGNWEEGLPSGHGSSKWSDGSSYEGNMSEGHLDGHGRFVWPDGSTYEGNFAKGVMQGQGRFDSRFDGGRFMQGRFHRNCFQRSDGKWVDVLRLLKGNEYKLIVAGNPLAEAAEAAAAAATATSMSSLIKRKKNAGSGVDATSLPVRRCSADDLRMHLAFALNQNLMPLVLAEDSMELSALDCFITSGAVTDPAAQCVSVRLAAVAQRRHSDYHRFFHDALKHSLLSGSFFSIVFEDDDGGCTLGADETGEANWISRRPSPGIPQHSVPQEWRLADFFNDSSLPPEIFTPTLFNARGRPKLFLPENVPSDSSGCNAAMAPADGDPADGEAGDGDGGDAAAEEKAQQAADLARQVGNLAAPTLSPPPASNVGPTGHIFELPADAIEGSPGTATEVAGMPVTHLLRPSLIATGRFPAGLADNDVRLMVRSRFGKHIPVHRLAVLLLTSGGQ
eukprot:TRINITY_DN37510_c0_g1_i1.p1 TRINITY_DN37510_c0_g1~~TRINITY_DN37510_c0_g1_i1.p1  ORF type:complete len:561 (+),score=129.40 TRINITY_DN37510_c0_g1_i1:77-1684(+)